VKSFDVIDDWNFDSRLRLFRDPGACIYFYID